MSSAFTLLQNTNSQNVPIMLTDISGNYILDATSATVTISKNGGGFAAANDGAFTNDASSGLYWVSLNSTDTNTLGPLVIRVVETGSVDSFAACYVRAKSESDIITDITGGIITQGNSAWATATGFATPADITSTINTMDVALGSDISTLNNISNNDVSGIVNGIVVNYDSVTYADLTGELGNLAFATPADVTSAIIGTSASFGEIANAILDSSTIDHTGAGTFGYNLQNPIPSNILTSSDLSSQLNDLSFATPGDITTAITGTNIVTFYDLTSELGSLTVNSNVAPADITSIADEIINRDGIQKLLSYSFGKFIIDTNTRTISFYNSSDSTTLEMVFTYSTDYKTRTIT